MPTAVGILTRSCQNRHSSHKFLQHLFRRRVLSNKQGRDALIIVHKKQTDVMNQSLLKEEDLIFCTCWQDKLMAYAG